MTSENSSQTPRAKILIGNRNSYSNGTSIGFSFDPIWEDVFTLYLDEKMMSSPKIIGCTYQDNCKEQAIEFGEIMKTKGLSTYDIINGQRMRHTTNEIVRCPEMPEDGLQIFRETLEQTLKTNYLKPFLNPIQQPFLP